MGDVHQVLDHEQRRGAVAIHPGGTLDSARRIARHDLFEQIQRPGAVGHAQKGAHPFRRDRTGRRVRLRDHPVEQGQAVAHRTVRCPCQHRDGLFGDCSLFPPGNIREMRRQFGLVEPPQVEALTA